jgi:hypothetical protein
MLKLLFQWIVYDLSCCKFKNRVTVSAPQDQDIRLTGGVKATENTGT